MGTERIGKLMRKYAIPCIISLLVGALYNIVDQIFIANASYLGSYGNAANTVVFPLTVVALAIAVMVGDGCCAFVSMALGRDEPQKAKRSELTVFFLSFFFGGLAQIVQRFGADRAGLFYDPAAPCGDGRVIIETESKSYHCAAFFI